MSGGGRGFFSYLFVYLKGHGFSVERMITRILLISRDRKAKRDLTKAAAHDHNSAFEIDQVSRFQKAIDVIGSRSYDLVVLAMATIKECTSVAEKFCEDYPDIPVIVFTPGSRTVNSSVFSNSAQFVLPKTVRDSVFLNQVISTALHRKKVENELRHRDEILQAVNYAAEMFLTQANWEACMDEVLTCLGKATGSERVYVFKNDRDEENKPIANLLSEWAQEGIQLKAEFDLTTGYRYEEKGLIRWMKNLSNGEAIWGNVTELPAAEQPLLMKMGVVSFIVMPIFFNDEWWGFIGFDQCREARQWSPIETDALRTAAKIFGAAISLQADRERLTHLATHDYLTGLPNRMLFNDRFQQAAARSERSGEKIAVISIDLDHFKTVNDSYGHPVGDFVLIEIGKRLIVAVRGSDTCARIGGDEFGVIAEGIRNRSDAMHVMEKLTDSLSSPVEVENQTIVISASMGAALYPDAGNELEAVMKLADKALYQVKGTHTGMRIYKDEQISLLDK